MTGSLEIVGDGPVGLLCALVAARRGPVRLVASRSRGPAREATAGATTAPAVECVPAALLTMLLEFGIVPAELDVTTLSRDRQVSWRSEVPRTHSGPAVAHVDRSALVGALRRRVLACAPVSVVTSVGPGKRIDASGRRAWSALAVHRPPRAWVASWCTVPRGRLDPRLRIAAGADGYGYRVGSGSWLTVAWVGPARPPRTGAELADRLEVARVAHAVGVPALASVGGRTARRVASASLPVSSPGVVAVGDAALARDALASQGTSIGLAEAYAVGTDPDHEQASLRVADGRRRHLRSLSAMLDDCLYTEAPVWTEYRSWVRQALGDATG